MINRALFNAYSVTPTSYTYGYLSDLLNIHKPIKTSGSSTTVTEVVSGDSPFSGAAVGDILEVTIDGAVTTRTITAVASDASVTVGTAVNWENSGAGRTASRRRFTSGTAATSGWFWVGDLDEKLVQINMTTVNATGVLVTIEGRVQAGPTVIAATIYSKTYTAAGTDGIPIGEDYDQIRVGVKVDTATGTNTISIYFAGHPKFR